MIATEDRKRALMLSALVLATDTEPLHRRGTVSRKLNVQDLVRAQRVLKCLGQALTEGNGEVIDVLESALPPVELAEEDVTEAEKDAAALSLSPPSEDVRPPPNDEPHLVHQVRPRVSASAPSEIPPAVPLRPPIAIVAPPVVESVAAESSIDLSRTLPADNVVTAAVIPFDGVAKPPAQLELQPHQAMGGTTFVQAIDVDDEFPFEMPSVVELNAQQYAALCAERALRPDRFAETRVTYGISDDQQMATLDGAWQRRLAEPNEKAAFDLHYAHYRAWLETHGC